MKKIISILLSLCIISTAFMIPTSAKASSSVVESAISWAIAIANDNSHGYSQSSRWGPDYDCSSFVISAFRNAGVNTGTATYTGNMRSQFTQYGFQWIPWSQIGSVSNLQRGDILLNEVTHTEIYLGNGQNVGAHSNRGYPRTGDQTGTEVSISGYYSHPWDGVLRYTGAEVCRCSTDYAGEYYVTTSSLPLTMRSGHGTGYSAVTSIPKGSKVFVSKSDGNWAHVEWNNYSGYCSMSYLSKIEQQAKSYNLHVWVSDTGMGDEASETVLGNRYYLCYELIDQTTGKKANETSNLSYQVTETIRNSSGKVFEHTYNNSDNNWISTVCNDEDTYTGTVTISGDINVSCSVTFDVWADIVPQLGAWAWEGDDSNKVTTISAGETVYCSYLIRDKNTKKNLNDVTTRCISGSGYTVTVKIYDPNGSVVKTKTYKNNDSVWIDFIPSKTGEYKMAVKVAGTISGSNESIFTAIEKNHSFGEWKVTKSSTCTATGLKKRTCSICGETESRTIEAAGHSMGGWNIIKSATCTSAGIKTRSCTICGKAEEQTIAATGHSIVIDEEIYNTTVTEASPGKNGSIVTKCTSCGEVQSTQTIYAPKTITLSKSSYVYNAKTQIPTIKVQDSKGKTIAAANYSVSYSGKCKTVGTYKVTLRFKGNYTGTLTASYKINPKSTTLSSVKAQSKQFKATWKKQSSQVDGYQIQYANNSKFKNAKTVTIGKNSTTSKTVKKLKSKTKYYVRVRTYKKVSGKYYYSSWSKSKSVKVK